jgi:hypothetical protein
LIHWENPLSEHRRLQKCSTSAKPCDVSTLNPALENVEHFVAPPPLDHGDLANAVLTAEVLTEGITLAKVVRHPLT